MVTCPDTVFGESGQVTNLSYGVARHFAKRHWNLPNDLDLPHYKRWVREHMPGHKAETRIIGSWNYARNVSSF